MGSNLRATGLFFVLRYFNLMVAFGKSWLVLGSIGVFSDFYSEIVYFNRFAPFLLLGTEVVSFRNLSRSNQNWNTKEVSYVIFAGLMVFLIASVFVPIWSLMYIFCSAIIRLVFNRLRLKQKQNFVALIEISINVIYFIVVALQNSALLKLIILLNFITLLSWIYSNMKVVTLDRISLENAIKFSIEGITIIVATSFSSILLIILLSVISTHADTPLWNQYNFGLSMASGLTLVFGSGIWYYQKELFGLERSKLFAVTMFISLAVLPLSYLLYLAILWVDPYVPGKDLSFVTFWIFIVASLIPSTAYQSYFVSNKKYFVLIVVMILSLTSTILTYYGLISVQSSGILACLIYTIGLGISAKYIHKIDK